MFGLNDQSSWPEINSIFKLIEGKTLRDLIPDESLLSRLRGKGHIGQLIETEIFGIQPNIRPEPDFILAGIELKVVPLEAKANGLGVKERTKVCSINYEKLVHETWMTSHARGKLMRVLLVFYEYDSNDVGNCRVIKCHLYEPDMTDQEIFEADWKTVLNYVKAGEAHLLSESIAKILSPSRTGQGGVNDSGVARDLVKQPNVRYSATAMKRAFSLKSGFTNQLYQEIKSKKRYVSLMELTDSSSLEDMLKRAVNGINQFTGWTLDQFAKHHGIDIPTGKNAAASIIRSALGVKKKDARFREFDRYGITVKVPPLKTDLSGTWEDVSFPHQPFSEIMDEPNFPDSMIADWTRIILFVPILRDKRDHVKPSHKRIGKAFVWKPTRQENEIMSAEYDWYQQTLEDGLIVSLQYDSNEKEYRSSNLPKKSETQILHMRTHGADANDVDTSYPGVVITKHCFWLNGSYVAKLARDNN